MMKFEQIKNTFSLFSLINKIYNERIVFTLRSVSSMSIHINKFSESEEITKLELESFYNTLRMYSNYIILGNILNLLERFEIKCDKHELITNIIYYSLILILLLININQIEIF